MRKTLLAILASTVALALAVVVSAAEPTSQPTHRQLKGGNPYKGLDLTREQKAQIKEIRKQAKNDMARAVTVDDKASIRKAADEKIRQIVLTDKQREQLAKNESLESKAAAEGKHEGKHHKGPAGESTGTKP
jgi:Spy/CpxP family protein refolding chaperone